jgi:hypothetical protein
MVSSVRMSNVAIALVERLSPEQLLSDWNTSCTQTDSRQFALGNSKVSIAGLTLIIDTVVSELSEKMTVAATPTEMNYRVFYEGRRKDHA